MIRFPSWSTCPIQSHNNISYMSYHRLSWFTLSFIEWWVRLKKGTCHLSVCLLCVPMLLLASKCLVRQSPTLGIVIHFHPDSSTTTPAQNLHCVPIHFKKGQNSSKISFWKYSIQEGHGVIIFLREREREVPMMLSKSSSKEEIQWNDPKMFPKVWVHFSLSPGHLWFHKIGIWSSTYLLRTTLRLGNIGNQGMSLFLPITPDISLRLGRSWSSFDLGEDHTSWAIESTFREL